MNRADRRASFGGRPANVLPRAAPRIANDEGFLLGLPGQQLIGIYVSDPAPDAMEAVSEGVPTGAATVSQAGDKHAVVARDQDKSRNVGAPFDGVVRVTREVVFV